MSLFHNFVPVTCCQCGVVFGLPQAIYDNRKQQKGSFWCPNGHSLTYGDTEHDRLIRERDRLKQREAMLVSDNAALEAERDATKKKLDRMVKRTTAGVCPCCSRSFKQLRAHLRAKHPNFATGGAAALP